MTDAPATPRPAATVLVLRDTPSAGGGAALELLMGLRHHLIDFAGGALVFPGGRVDQNDFVLSERRALCPHPSGVSGVELASRVAGIRETFEESGILFARRDGAQELVSANDVAALEEPRHRLHAGELSFADLLREARLSLACDLLVPFAHWITPVVFPKRYDTLFFLAAAPPAQVAIHDGHGSVASRWVSPRQALADADAGSCKLEFATRRNLEKIGRHDRMADAFKSARLAPIVTVLPEVTESPSGPRVRIPLAADYGGEDFPMNR